MASTQIFVYGTLLRGERNHHLLHGATTLGGGRTAAAYELVDAGGFPAMISGGATAVVGEVYAVDGTTLAAIDRLEDHPNFYRRTPIRLADGRWAEVYLLDRGHTAGMPPLPSGDWRAVTARTRRTWRGTTT